MTTIAYRDGVMAGDTAVTDRGTYCGASRKVFHHGGALLGFCGCLGAMAQVRDWFLAGAEGEPPELSGDSEGLIIRTDGKAEWLGPPRKRVEIDGDYFAIGSGFQIAMGALAAGASAERAIEIACDMDVLTRRPITILKAAG